MHSRFKLLAYSYEVSKATLRKSWTNGLCFYLWSIAWLRRHGVTATITFTVDHGEEFGGKSWLKVQELRKLIAGEGASSFRTTRACPERSRRGHPQENAHLERSHRTDDDRRSALEDEFYIPRVLTFTSEQRELL